jgi:hypothetical protein
MKKQFIPIQFPRNLLLSVLLIFSACGPDLHFQEPQPKGWPVLTAFPEDFQGKWEVPSDPDFVLITQGVIYLFDQEKTVILLDSLSQNGLVLEGDSLFQMGVRSFPSPQLEALQELPRPDQEAGLPMDTNLYRAEDRIFIRNGKLFHFSAFKKNTFAAIYQPDLTDIHPLLTPLTNKQDSLVLVEKTFLGRVGETTLKEIANEEGRIYMMYAATGPQPFVHQDSTRISIQGDSLYILTSQMGPFYRIHHNVVVKAGEGYLFLNEPVPDKSAWTLTVMHKPDAKHLRYTQFNDEIELARAFFEVIADPVSAPGDTLFGHFASPTVEELMQFLEADSLDWGEELESGG